MLGIGALPGIVRLPKVWLPNGFRDGSMRGWGRWKRGFRGDHAMMMCPNVHAGACALSVATFPAGLHQCRPG